jgi:hypothetical protein
MGLGFKELNYQLLLRQHRGHAFMCQSSRFSNPVLLNVSVTTNRLLGLLETNEFHGQQLGWHTVVTQPGVNPLSGTGKAIGTFGTRLRPKKFLTPSAGFGLYLRMN